MSAQIMDITEAARDVAAAAVGAQFKYAALPTGQALSVPAVIVDCTGTRPEYSNHNTRTSEGKQTASGVKRTHYGKMWAILSITGDVNRDARAQERALQDVQDAFDADVTLYRNGFDTVARFRLIEPKKFREESDGSVLSGVTADWEAMEL